MSLRRYIGRIDFLLVAYRFLISELFFFIASLFNFAVTSGLGNVSCGSELEDARQARRTPRSTLGFPACPEAEDLDNQALAYQTNNVYSNAYIYIYICRPLFRGCHQAAEQQPSPTIQQLPS